MTSTITVDEYLEFLAKEYLVDYVRVGGGAVKFCVGSPAALDAIETGLQTIADDNNYVHAGIDAAETKLSMTDQILCAVTRSLDLGELGRSLSATAYGAIGFPPDGDGLEVTAVAKHHQVDPGELFRSVRRRLEQTVLADRLLPRDLRLALFRLAQHQLGLGDVSDVEVDAIECWLTGRPASSPALRSSGIRYRITRANAHRLLVALPRALATGGHRGLVINLRLERLGTDRPKVDRQGHYYSKASRLDVYEVVRQLIDATEALRHCLLVITLPETLFDDPTRGPFAYQALTMRLVGDVADRHLPNPFASVVRLTTLQERP